MQKLILNNIVSITLFLIVVNFTNALSQPPDVLWSRSYGGAGTEAINSIEQTKDGGFISVGYTTSFGAGDYDIWLIRTDNIGNVIWAKTFGGANFDRGNDVCQTSSGGFALTGATNSFNSDTSDVIIIITDSLGNLVSRRLYGGHMLDYGNSIQQTSSGGLIVSGQTVDSLHHSDGVLLLTDSLGNLDWYKVFDRQDYDFLESAIETHNGGFAVSGQTAGSDLYYDTWLICTDDAGNPYCDKTYGGSSSEYGYSIQETFDSGFIIAGNTYSYGNGSSDMWLIRTDSAGDTIWTKAFGGSETELGFAGLQTSDSGFVISGSTSSYGNGGQDFWIVKTDLSGDTTWTRTVGSTEADRANSIVQTTDGGYAVAGWSGSNAWIVRLDSAAVISDVTSTVWQQPDKWKLFQNYPNPFNPTTQIKYQITQNAQVTLEIFNTLGQKITTLVNTKQQAGDYSVEWDGSNLASGVYYYRLKVGDPSAGSGKYFVQTKKMMLMR